MVFSDENRTVVFYEIYDRDGPIDAAPRFSSADAAIEMARYYSDQGRAGVRIDRVETIWTGDDDV